MNQQPDKLFREKLHGYQKQAPASAWARIESGLAKKNNNALWYRAAAAIVVLLVGGLYLLVRENNSAITTPSANNDKKVETPSVQPPSDNIARSTTPAVVESPPANENTQPAISKKPRVKQFRKQLPSVIDEKPVIDPVAVHEPIEPASETAPVIIADVRPEEAQTVQAEVMTETQPEETGVVIVLSTEQVDEKYLDKKALAEATQKDKKPSTFKKLLEKAYDLKHNQEAIGGLRQKKNEILALNFKNEKQRSQNR